MGGAIHTPANTRVISSTRVPANGNVLGSDAAGASRLSDVDRKGRRCEVILSESLIAVLVLLRDLVALHARQISIMILRFKYV